MSIQFSNGTITVSSFAATTTATLIAGIQAALTASGWTVVSGAGTTNLLMQTLTTPQGLAMRYKFHDNSFLVSSQATIQLSMQTVSGSIVGADLNTGNSPWLRVNASTNYKVICGPYYFWILVPGSYADYGFWAMGGVPWTSSFQTSVTQIGYLVCKVKGTGSLTQVIPTFRDNVTCCLNNQVPQQQLIYNTNYISLDGNAQSGNNNQGDSGMLRPWLPAVNTQYTNNSPSMNQNVFTDGSFATADPWIGWDISRSGYPASSGDASSINGMLWDAVFIFDNSQVGDATATFDGHTWFNISNLQMPSLWVATS